MRLIDADAFVENHRKWYCENCERRKNSKGKFVYEVGGVPCRACRIGDMIDDVDSAQTVDAVPVVRCGGCKHYVVLKMGNKELPFPVCEHFGMKMPSDEFYCAGGERREE